MGNILCVWCSLNEQRIEPGGTGTGTGILTLVSFSATRRDGGGYVLQWLEKKNTQLENSIIKQLDDIDDLSKENVKLKSEYLKCIS